jgi:hypothetical protein
MPAEIAEKVLALEVELEVSVVLALELSSEVTEVLVLEVGRKNARTRAPSVPVIRASHGNFNRKTVDAGGDRKLRRRLRLRGGDAGYFQGSIVHSESP